MADDHPFQSVDRRTALKTFGTTGIVAGLGVGPSVAGTRDQTVTRGRAPAWPQFMHDAANTGYDTHASGPEADVATRWTVRPDDTSPLVVANDTVYVGGGQLRALDAADGSERWTSERTNGSVSSPTVGGDAVYAGLHFEDADDRDAVVALNATTGAKRWAFTDDGTDDFGRLTVASGTVYATAQRPHENWLYALDAATGTKRWATTIGSPGLAGTGTANVAVVDGAVFVPGAQTLHARAAETGAVLWRADPVDMYNEPAAAPAVADGTVYVGGQGADAGHSDQFFAVNAGDGSIEWRFEPGNDQDERWHAPAVADGSVYVTRWATDGGVLYALDAETGAEQWAVDVSHALNPAVANGVVYGGDVAFDAATGAELWRTDLDVGVAAVDDGTVYVAGEVVAALVEAPNGEGEQSPETPTETPTESGTTSETPTDGEPSTVTPSGGDDAGCPDDG